MAKVKIEEVVDHLSSEFTRALEKAVLKHAPDAQFNRVQLFRDLQREVGRACSTWETIPDRYIKDWEG